MNAIPQPCQLCATEETRERQLRWDWEILVKLAAGLICSVFEVPRAYVKGRKSLGCLVCNSVAQQVVDAARGRHDEFVFV